MQDNVNRERPDEEDDGTIEECYWAITDYDSSSVESIIEIQEFNIERLEDALTAYQCPLGPEIARREFALLLKEFERDETPDPIIGREPVYIIAATFVPLSDVEPPRLFEDWSSIPDELYEMMVRASRSK